MPPEYPHIIPHTDPTALDKALAALKQGEVIAIPTDTVYGVAALALNPAAAANIYRVKARPANKPLPVFVSSPTVVQRVARDISPLAQQVLNRYLPGALTVILPAQPILPAVVTNGGHTVAVRVPNYPPVLNLLARLDQPLAVTSANLSGRPTPATAAGVAAELAGRITLVIDGGPSATDAQPSTIIDFSVSPPRVLRQGALMVAL